MNLHWRRRILALAALAESATGLLLVVAPAVVIDLLLGTPITDIGAVIGRCFGFALMGLGIACWPLVSAPSNPMPRLGMTGYNALVAVYLAYLGFASLAHGVLLWPTALLHAAVSLLLWWPATTGTSPLPSAR